MLAGLCATRILADFGIAKAIGESGTHLVETWSKRVQLINSVDTGSHHRLLNDEVKFPDSMGAEIP